MDKIGKLTIWTKIGQNRTKSAKKQNGKIDNVD